MILIQVILRPHLEKHDQGRENVHSPSCLVPRQDSPNSVSSVSPIGIAMILFLARVHLESLPAGVGGAHLQSPMQNQHLNTTCDSRICLAFWPSGHKLTQQTVIDRIVNSIVFKAASFCSAIGQLFCLDNELSFLEI